MFLSAVSEPKKNKSPGNLQKTCKKFHTRRKCGSDSEIFLHYADFLALTFSKTPANAGKNI